MPYAFPSGEDRHGLESSGPHPPRFPGMVALDNDLPSSQRAQGVIGPRGQPIDPQQHSSSGFNRPDLNHLGEEQTEVSAHLSQAGM